MSNVVASEFIFIKCRKHLTFIIEEALICPFALGGLALFVNIFLSRFGCPADTFARNPQRLPIEYSVNTRAFGIGKEIAYKIRLTLGC